jgi:hypothetical protein
MKEKNCSKLTDGLSTFFVSLTNGKLGKKYYSPYFKQMIEVVKYVDDNHWSFKLENGEVYAAKTPLSYFKEHDFTRDNPKRAVKQDMSKGQFVDCTDKTNDKIEEILSKYPVPVYCWYSMIKKLSTIIQEERKDAVIGFAYYLLKRRNKDEFWGLSEGEVEMAMIVAKQYLESEK